MLVPWLNLGSDLVGGLLNRRVQIVSGYTTAAVTERVAHLVHQGSLF